MNRTNVPFVLSMDGIYSFALNGYRVVNLPISPYMAVSLIHKSYAGRVFNEDGSINMFEIYEEKIIEVMNERAFSTQLKREWGYVVCPEKDELDRLKELYCAKVGWTSSTRAATLSRCTAAVLWPIKHSDFQTLAGIYSSVWICFHV